LFAKVDVVKAWAEASNANPPASTAEASQKYLADDFHNLDKDGKPIMDKQAFTGMGTVLYNAFDGFKMTSENFREEGDGVVWDFHAEGTFSKDLDLSAMGMGVIKATGKKLTWPTASSKAMVEGDKITAIHDVSGGMEWFLAPLGVKPPGA
jgi:hypothetical protein